VDVRYAAQVEQDGIGLPGRAADGAAHHLDEQARRAASAGDDATRGLWGIEPFGEDVDVDEYLACTCAERRNGGAPFWPWCLAGHESGTDARCPEPFEAFLGMLDVLAKDDRLTPARVLEVGLNGLNGDAARFQEFLGPHYATRGEDAKLGELRGRGAHHDVVEGMSEAAAITALWRRSEANAERLGPHRVELGPFVADMVMAFVLNDEGRGGRVAAKCGLHGGDGYAGHVGAESLERAMGLIDELRAVGEPHDAVRRRTC